MKLGLVCCLIVALCAGIPIPTQAVTETVEYPKDMGFKSITYGSEFFGYQAGINRDFTNYGRSFAEPVTSDLGWGKVQVAMADFDGDGLDDIAGYSEASGEVTWLSGKGDGSFGEKHTFQAQAKGTFVAGDFNGDQRADIGIVKSGKFYFSGKEENLKAPGGQMVAGDFNGDGLADICVYRDGGKISLLVRKKGGGFEEQKTVWPGKEGRVTAADFNGDHYCDLAVYGSTVNPGGFAFRFGRGDGTFGPTQAQIEIADGRDQQLQATFSWLMPDALPVAGQVDDDGSADVGLYVPATGQLLTRLEAGHPAYDYSVHLIKDGDNYRMWHGGRWRTVNKNGEPLPNADGDHVLSASSSDGRTWFRRIDAAEFPKGDEQGFTDWWTNNYLEPEVIKVKGIYYMFWQAEVDGGSALGGDTGGVAARQADRIGISVSTDGEHWQRKTDRGVVVNIANPTVTNLDHEELIYVPDDKDGKPWWLYTFHFIDGKASGHVRIRSNDPSTFDWNAREPAAGMSQIGNQIGYADEAPGGRMFVRITFTGNKEGRTVPTLQLSRDGLSWFGGDKPMLASTANNKNNRNVYFLGLSTIDGTGKIEQLKDGRFHALYGATTSNSPGQPEIWFSEIGIGEVFFSFNRD